MIHTRAKTGTKPARRGKANAARKPRTVMLVATRKPADNVINQRINTERARKKAGVRALSTRLFVWRNTRWDVLDG